ncbi:deoxyribodipyrimidine photo-lyase [Buchnera aphidicola (Muscaphis stroyani)]|uniref:Deoxyribodipyrimidine photo-lyase n=1 Tax=Buchnera aphidicola (Muscaphis stroyani) TaxID=1241869 RepID=A0A4D6YCU6_9GAMM|nr:deoxyribodipyrimidine photo-lyase [Buchnera aphidicola]QCI24371.1 deoxyribodipyrimidine photo-lyase [Buchnera aphidicola (Muscaphis stroyani)]
MKKNLVWFRNDLRVYDNTALYQSCKFYEDKVIALFIDTPEQWKNHFISQKKISFMHHNLISLEEKLSEINITLYYYQSTTFLQSIKYLIHFCHQKKINNLFYNYQYEINERNRDYIVKKKLSEQGILVKGFHDSILVPINDIKNKKKNSYKKFSIFNEKIKKYLKKNIIRCLPIPIKRKDKDNDATSFFKFKKSIIKFNKKIFPIGEQAAVERLKNFFKYKINDYSFNRNIPSLDGTSMLSPYLSIGIISSRRCFFMFLKNKNSNPPDTIYNSSWFNEIIWREFYYHLLVSHPNLSKSKSMSEWENFMNWENNSNYFDAWKNGCTGFPIVDAGMRQLKEIGWMHPRLRMITSSFLVKNLLIDWRKGEKYFMSQLIDGDFAINNGGWQWCSSFGTDYVPYIRFFNPFLQSKKIDKSGNFIKNFIPELNNVPNNFIHNPHEWSNKKKCFVNYPDPIVDYNDTKKKFMLIFNKAQLEFKKQV